MVAPALGGGNKNLKLLNLYVFFSSLHSDKMFSSSVSLVYATAKLMYVFNALLVLYLLIDIPHIYFQKVKSYLFCKIQLK